MAIENFDDNFIELEKKSEWHDKVRGFQLGSWVQGGANGVDNVPIKELADRTEYLKDAVDEINESLGNVDGASGLDLLSPAILFASDKRKITIRKGTFADEDTELDIAAILDTGNLVNGKNYYLFELPRVDDARVYKASLVKTPGEGETILGGFHTLCADVGAGLTYVEGGETKQHPLNGYVAGDILPYSVWSLNFRPHCEPEGMVYIPSLDIWVDIYLQSGSGANTKSEYQGALTRSRQYVDHVEDMFCVKKELLDDGEFAASMLGSNEMTNIVGSTITGKSAGGNTDTAGRRMISVYGVEDGCGLLWQWLRTTSAAGYDGVFYGQSSAQGVEPPTYGQITSSTAGSGPFAQSGGKGSFYGVACALLAGGHYTNGAGCGSRARNACSGRSF